MGLPMTFMKYFPCSRYGKNGPRISGCSHLSHGSVASWSPVHLATLDDTSMASLRRVLRAACDPEYDGPELRTVSPRRLLTVTLPYSWRLESLLSPANIYLDSSFGPFSSATLASPVLELFLHEVNIRKWIVQCNRPFFLVHTCYWRIPSGTITTWTVLRLVTLRN